MTDTADSDKRASLLFVDDDRTLCDVMSRALGTRGFAVTVAYSIDEALRAIGAESPEYAVIDLKLRDQSGLKLIARLKESDPNTNIVVLTGHGSIPTAVEAIKLGATHYLTKPTDADAVVAAFKLRGGNADLPIDTKPMTVERVEWEHIQKVLSDNGGNVSATARALSMHRRTLQRKLKRGPGKG